MTRLRTKRYRGFSLIELVLVVAIMLAIAAMAMPQFLTFTASYRLRNGLNAVAGVMQQARMEAIRKNTTVQVVNSASGSSSIVFADLDGDGNWSGGEPGAQLPKQVQVKTSGYPGDAYASLWTGLTTSYSAESQSTAIKFNSRGLPCVVLSGTVCTNLDTTGGGGTPVGFVRYVQNTGTGSAWGAVTISPAGRIQTSTWNGSSYSQQ